MSQEFSAIVHEDGKLYGVTEDGDRVAIPFESISAGDLNNTTLYLDAPVETGDIRDAAEELHQNHGGGEIVVPEGEHAGFFGIEHDNITVRGRSKAATLKTPDGHDSPTQVLTIAADNVLVRDLTVDGNKYNQDIDTSGDVSSDYREADTIGIYGNFVTTFNVDVFRSTSHGIQGWGELSDPNEHAAANVTGDKGAARRFGIKILDCHAEDISLLNQNPRDALETFYCEGTVIANNTVRIGRTACALHRGFNAVVHGNVAEDCRWLASANDFVDNVVISDNTLEINNPDNVSGGVDAAFEVLARTENHTVGNLTISDNVAHVGDDADHFVMIDGSGDGEIVDPIKLHNNRFSGDPDEKLHLEDAEVEIRNNSWAGDAGYTLAGDLSGSDIEDASLFTFEDGDSSTALSLTIDGLNGPQTLTIKGFVQVYDSSDEIAVRFNGIDDTDAYEWVPIATGSVTDADEGRVGRLRTLRPAKLTLEIDNPTDIRGDDSRAQYESSMPVEGRIDSSNFVGAIKQNVTLSQIDLLTESGENCEADLWIDEIQW